jgi:hypothetical protein
LANLGLASWFGASIRHASVRLDALVGPVGAFV